MLKIGDHVEVISTLSLDIYEPKSGLQGTVKFIDHSILGRTDNPTCLVSIPGFSGHNGGMEMFETNCWWINESCLKVVTD